MIETFAVFYVDYLEPLLRVAFFLIIAIVLLYFINLIRDAKEKGNIINAIFSSMIKLITAIFVWSGHALVWSGKTLLKTITVIIAVIRDFFGSRI
ncbi:MAG: hypothetical protein EBQ80_03560 [Proteobacteria bacterium]|nr:hypothetical protein [Pseudomonadota bacterium]